MNQLDLLYRAFLEYRRKTQDDTACRKERALISLASKENDKLESVKLICTIEEDWVKQIEDGLVFIANAIKEERQFITTNGEVVPIEKAKKISKASIEHLERHSGLITKIPEDPEDDLIPDKIYMVEKLSDYAIYENRFLYMLLAYLRDFVDLRLLKIREAINSYTGSFNIDKTIKTKNRLLKIKTDFYEKRTDNPYPFIDLETKELIKRIEDCQRIIASLLQTDLMVQVSKAPMVKPPIVKTNILKMNNNFRHAVSLYDYISNYIKDGYSVKEVKKSYDPFSDDLADEFAEITSLTSFISFIVGNELKPQLKQQYEEEEKRRKQEESKQLAEQVLNLKRRMKENKATPEEYMLMLEKRNRELESDNKNIVHLKNELDEFKKKNDELISMNKDLTELNTSLKNNLRSKEAELRRNKERFDLNLTSLLNYHDLVVESLNEKHLSSIEIGNEQYKLETDAIKERYESEKLPLIHKYENEINVLRTTYEDQIANLIRENDDRIYKLEQQHEAQIQEISDNTTLELEEMNKRYEKDKEEIEKDFEVRVSKLESEFERDKKIVIEDYDVKLSQIEYREAHFDEEKEKQKLEYEEKLQALDEKINILEAEKQNIISDCEKKIEEINRFADERVNDVKAEFANQLVVEKQKNDEILNEKKNECEALVLEAKEEVSRIEEEKQKLEEIRIQLSAELHGLRKKNGLILETEDYSSREKFEELELEFLSFSKLFDESWSKAKKAIRKNVLWNHLKKQEKKKEKLIKKGKPLPLETDELDEEVDNVANTDAIIDNEKVEAENNLINSEDNATDKVCEESQPIENVEKEAIANEDEEKVETDTAIANMTLDEKEFEENKTTDVETKEETKENVVNVEEKPIDSKEDKVNDDKLAEAQEEIALKTLETEKDNSIDSDAKPIQEEASEASKPVVDSKALDTNTNEEKTLEEASKPKKVVVVKATKPKAETKKVITRTPKKDEPKKGVIRITKKEDNE